MTFLVAHGERVAHHAEQLLSTVATRGSRQARVDAMTGYGQAAAETTLIASKRSSTVAATRLCEPNGSAIGMP
ncbi:hypothetical protein MGAD_01440 [Mycolicibacterium gadium]|uniref:Uncharacterized protein n=1 Tax=Mycolicibacterium gadium TaxID=1794 RepID=A0A7I7WE48_MYCGU|nr:hypothetical protein MGAD_01440 [Mycolicibacterium gadium]